MRNRWSSLKPTDKVKLMAAGMIAAGAVIASLITLLGQGPGWFRISQQVLELEITAPADGAAVPRRPRVIGTSSRPDATVWIIVRPTELEEFYVQPEVSIEQNGNWSVSIYIGRAGQLDVGKQFEVMAVANPVETLQEGQLLGDWPEAEARSEVITATRR